MKNNRYDYFIYYNYRFIYFIYHYSFFFVVQWRLHSFGGVLLSELLIIGAPPLRCFGSV